jgi:hypothetical protein
MTPLERGGYIAHARTAAHRRLVAEALACIEQALRIAPAHIACSWGKDSTAMAEMVLRVNPRIPVVFYTCPNQELLDDYDRVRDEFLRLHPELEYHEIDVAGPRIPHKVENARLWERWPLVFMGIRAEESAGRRPRLFRWMEPVEEMVPMAHSDAGSEERLDLVARDAG